MVGNNHLARQTIYFLLRKIYREISNRDMDNFLSFNEVRAKWNVIRSRVLFQFDSCSPVITGWWRKSQQSWRFNPKGRVEREKRREAGGKKRGRGAWKFKISHVILEVVHRFRKLHKRTSRGPTSPGKRANKRGETKRKQKKKKEDGETNRRARGRRKRKWNEQRAVVIGRTVGK